MLNVWLRPEEGISINRKEEEVPSGMMTVMITTIIEHLLLEIKF